MVSKDERKTGKWLEKKTAALYRELGAEVNHNESLAGKQIDVYVVFPTADNGEHRIAVEAKDYGRSVGIDVVTNFDNVLSSLRDKNYVDEGVIVSTSGFSKDAREGARAGGIRLLSVDDLEAYVTRYKDNSARTRVAVLWHHFTSGFIDEENLPGFWGNIFGSMTGLLIGAFFGWFGSRYSNLPNPTLWIGLGTLVGAVLGWFGELQAVWVLVAIFNGLILGTLVGIVTSLFRSTGAYSTFEEVLILGGFMGAVVGGMTRFLISDFVEELASNLVLIKVTRQLLGPILGIVLGVTMAAIWHFIDFSKLGLKEPLEFALFGSVMGFIVAATYLLIPLEFFVLSIRFRRKKD